MLFQVLNRIWVFSILQNYRWEAVLLQLAHSYQSNDIWMLELPVRDYFADYGLIR